MLESNRNRNIAIQKEIGKRRKKERKNIQTKKEKNTQNHHHHPYMDYNNRNDREACRDKLLNTLCDTINQFKKQLQQLQSNEASTIQNMLRVDIETMQQVWNTVEKRKRISSKYIEENCILLELEGMCDEEEEEKEQQGEEGEEAEGEEGEEEGQEKQQYDQNFNYKNCNSKSSNSISLDILDLYYK